MTGGRLLAYILIASWTGGSAHSASMAAVYGQAWPAIVVPAVLALLAAALLVRMATLDVKDGVLR